MMKNKKYNKTHEECEDCAYVCDDNSPCDGHPSGPVSCYFFKKRYNEKCENCDNRV